MTKIPELVRKLGAIPPGKSGWRDFEVVCTEILTYLFVPPLSPPKSQPRTLSGIERRDAIFPNRQDIENNHWAKIYRSLDARLILFEFKNYDKIDIGKDEVDQTRNYLRGSMGRLAIICSNKIPTEQAHIRRNTVYSEEKKLILFITKDKLEEMLYIKERGDDPGDLIMDEIENFLIQHE